MFGKFLKIVRANLRWFILFFLFAICLFLFFMIYFEDRHGKLMIAFLNIGQGDATLIISPTGEKILIDGGPGKTILAELPKVIPFWDKHLDAVIIDNSDSDHYEGIISLLKKYQVDVIIESGTTGNNTEYDVLEKEISTQKIPKITALRGQIIDIGGGAYIEVLFPDRDISGLATNNGSIIERLVFGKTSVMFEGDAPQAMEKYVLSLAQRGNSSLVSTILHAGHHGSKTSSAQDYVAAIRPQYAIVSAATSNFYGHPHQQTLDTFSALRTTILATCTMGRITFHSDGNLLTLENKKITPVSAGCK